MEEIIKELKKELEEAQEKYATPYLESRYSMGKIVALSRAIEIVKSHIAVDKAESDKTDTAEGAIQWIKDDITEETIGLENALQDIGTTVWHNDPGFDDHMRYIIDTKRKIDVLKELLEELQG